MIRKVFLAIESFLKSIFHGEVEPYEKPIIPIMDTPTKKDLIEEMALYISQYEGGPKDRNHRNCNPGNIRCATIKNGRASGMDKDGFCIFPTWEIGMAALVEKLRNAAMGASKVYFPTDTMMQFFAKYSPTNDGNQPSAYCSWVCKKIGIPISTQLKDLI